MRERARAEPCGRRDRKKNEGKGLLLANKQTHAQKHACTHTCARFSPYLPSNSAGPTPTIIIDMGRDAACGVEGATIGTSKVGEGSREHSFHHCAILDTAG